MARRWIGVLPPKMHVSSLSTSIHHFSIDGALVSRVRNLGLAAILPLIPASGDERLLKPGMITIG